MAGFDVSFWSLFYKMISRRTGQLSKVRFEAKKPRFDNTPIEQSFQRVSPENVGISSDYVKEFIGELGASKDAQPHHLMLMRHGRVFAEMSFGPYVRNMWHITHSMCKTMTGMAVGLLWDEGLISLDETVDSLFPELVPLLGRLGRKQVTVEMLLNMTGNVDFSEAGAISGNEWKKGFMQASFKADPGTAFDYNSMNSYMLSAIVQLKTGESMFSYLKRKLFDPMGITEIYWEESPEGITKGGWGMLIRPEDALKLGYLYLNQGSWKGQQLLSAEWVNMATTKQVENDSFGYGFQLWMEEREGSFAFNGLFGQNIIIYPDMDMVLMINAGNRELTAGGELTGILRKYWGAPFMPLEEPLPENGIGLSELRTLISRYEGILNPPQKVRSGWGIYPKEKAVIDTNEVIDILDGHSFSMKHGSIGIFPLISQVMHVNFTDGISEVGFLKCEEGDRMTLLLGEGEETHRVTLGLIKPCISEINLHGDPYLISAKGHFTTDERGRVTLICRLTILEEGMDRILRLYFDGEELEMRATEKPGDAVIVDALSYTSDTPALERLPFVKNIMEGGAMDLVDITLQSTINPVDYGTLKHEMPELSE